MKTQNLNVLQHTEHIQSRVVDTEKTEKMFRHQSIRVKISIKVIHFNFLNATNN